MVSVCKKVMDKGYKVYIQPMITLRYTDSELLELIDLVKSGKVDVLKMVSGVYSANDAEQAFESLKNNDGTLAKLLIEF